MTTSPIEPWKGDAGAGDQSIRTVTPLRAAAPPRLVGGADGAASTSPQLAAPTPSEAAVKALRDALDAYLGSSRPENGYATLTAAARACGCPAGSAVILWSREFLGHSVTPGLADVVASIVRTNSLERVIAEGPRQFAIGSEDGAA